LLFEQTDLLQFRVALFLELFLMLLENLVQGTASGYQRLYFRG